MKSKPVWRTGRSDVYKRQGSPQAQRIMIARQSNLEMKKELAKKIARIK